MAAPYSTRAAIATPAPTAALVPSAVGEVLGVPELLENILLQLRKPGTHEHWSTGVEDLFVFQRVCTQFRDIIQRSIRIRRAMFLEYDENNGPLHFGLEFLLEREGGRLRRNPRFPSIVLSRFIKDPLGNDEVLLDCAYLRPSFPGRRSRNRARLFPVRRPVRQSTMGKFFAKDASWRHMKLFGQPIQSCIRMFSTLTMEANVQSETSHWPVLVFDQPTQLLGLAVDSLHAGANHSSEHCFQFGRACAAAYECFLNAGRAWSRGGTLDHPFVREHLYRVRSHNEHRANCRREKGDCVWCSTFRWSWWSKLQDEPGPYMDLMAAASRAGEI